MTVPVTVPILQLYLHSKATAQCLMLTSMPVRPYLCCIDEVHGLPIHNAEDRDDCAELTSGSMCTSTSCTP